MGTMRPSSACWLWQGRHQSVSPALQEDGGREEEDKVLPVLQVVNEALGEGLDLVHQGPIGLQPQGHTLGGVQHKEQVHRAVWARDRRRGSALRSPFPRGAPPAALATSPASHPLIPSQAPTLLKEQGDVSHCVSKLNLKLPGRGLTFRRGWVGPGDRFLSDHKEGIRRS